VNSLALTEKQQEALWLRYGRQASINQIAAWLHISRRAVLSRLRNARRRATKAGVELPEHIARPVQNNQRLRTYPASQLAGESGGIGIQLDEL
jgi:predicted DNA-binding protein YlxM (UPF0122 family)